MKDIRLTECHISQVMLNAFGVKSFIKVRQRYSTTNSNPRDVVRVGRAADSAHGARWEKRKTRKQT